MMAGEKSEQGHDAEHNHGAPVPRLLLLVYLLIAVFFVYYLITGLKFGGNSPTGF